MRANHHSRISSAKITYRTLPSDPDKMSKGHRPTTVFVYIFKSFFWFFSCSPMTFVNQNCGKIRMFWDESNLKFEDSKGWSWFTRILTLLASQAPEIWKFKTLKDIVYIQVNLCQKHLFSHQLTHNTTKDCSLIYQFSTWKLHGENMLCA